jgi:hypothetical protein
MSRMTITRYRDRQAERRRAEQREIQRVRKELQRCLQLERDLAALEDVQTGQYAQSLSRLDAAQGGGGQTVSSAERQQWLERLSNDAERLEQSIAAAHERRIQLEFAALSLVRGADGETQQILEDCARRARRAKRDEFSSLKRKVEAIVTNRITKNRPTARQTQSEESLKLAATLMRSVADIKHLAPPQTGRQVEPKIKKLIADISALGFEAGNLLDRAQRLLSLEDERGFDLKLDSLMMEASELSTAARSRRELRAEMDGAEEALEPFDDPSSTALKARLAELKSTVNASAIRTAISSAKKHAEQIAAQQDAQRARNLILEGLQELGYEVHLQGDVWGPGARIAVQKPDEPNYDVQLAAASDGRVQTKVRAYAHSGRSSGINKRDVEIEGTWCADLIKLNEQLLTAGIEARLDHEDAPGTALQIPIERSSIEPPRVTIPPRMRSRTRN